MPNEEEILKYGLIEETEVFAKDWRVQGISGASKEVLREDGDYTAFLPSAEYQRGVYFDTYACVTYSALNCIETILNVKGLRLNNSDRFTAKMSGTTKDGNHARHVAESIRRDGAVVEERWPFPREQKRPVFDWEHYYSEIPQEIVFEGIQCAWREHVQWEWIPPAVVRSYLKYGPIQVGVWAWPKPLESGMYNDGGVAKRNHAVMLFNATDDYYEIYDHYDKVIKRLVPDYRFGFALQFSFANETNMPTLPDNILVQDVEGTGAFGMHLNGKIIVGPAAEILATVIMRSETGADGGALLKTRPLSKADWGSFPKVDTKGNPAD